MLQLRHAACLPLFAFALALGARHAAAEITIPDCATLGAWAAAIDAEDGYAVAPKLALPNALTDERLLPVFGASALDWTRDDVKVAGKTIKTCSAEAKKAGDAARLEAMKTAGRLLGKTLPQTQAAIAKGVADADKQSEAILALPDSPELAKAIGALLALDPAAPDARALGNPPRPIATPLSRLVKDLGWVPDAKRAALFAALAERRTAILDGLAGALGAAIDGAPADADGVLAIMAARQTLASAGPSEQLTAGTDAAEQRMAGIREGLRAAAPPPWVPPACLELYRWSGAAGASEVVSLGVQSIRAAFLDEAVVPVFGRSVADWSDADLARFATLRGQCQAEWTALLPAGTRIDAVGDDAPELLRLASAGRWIDGADRPVENARAVVATHRATQAALEAARQQIAALPDGVDSLAALKGLQATPELGQASREEREAFERIVTAKRAAIMARALADAETELAAIEIAALGDFKTLYVFANATAPRLPDAETRGRFLHGVDAKASRAVLRLLRDFEAALDAMPETLDGLGQAWRATDALTGVRGAKGAAPFAGFQQAALARARAIADGLRAGNCAALLDALGIDEDDAARPLWDGRQGMPFGRFVCNIATGGGEISDYDGGGSPELEIMMPLSGLTRIALHEGEVRPGEAMLIGYRVEDANARRDLTVQEWVVFAAFWVGDGGRIVIDEMCAPLAGKAEDDLSIPERMLALDCTIERLQRER